MSTISWTTVDGEALTGKIKETVNLECHGVILFGGALGEFVEDMEEADIPTFYVLVSVRPRRAGGTISFKDIIIPSATNALQQIFRAIGFNVDDQINVAMVQKTYTGYHLVSVDNEVYDMAVPIDGEGVKVIAEKKKKEKKKPGPKPEDILRRNRDQILNALHDDAVERELYVDQWPIENGRTNRWDLEAAANTVPDTLRDLYGTAELRRDYNQSVGWTVFNERLYRNYDNLEEGEIDDDDFNAQYFRERSRFKTTQILDKLLALPGRVKIFTEKKQDDDDEYDEKCPKPASNEERLERLMQLYEERALTAFTLQVRYFAVLEYYREDFDADVSLDYFRTTGYRDTVAGLEQALGGEVVYPFIEDAVADIQQVWRNMRNNNNFQASHVLYDMIFTIAEIDRCIAKLVQGTHIPFTELFGTLEPRIVALVEADIEPHDPGDDDDDIIDHYTNAIERYESAQANIPEGEDGENEATAKQNTTRMNTYYGLHQDVIDAFEYLKYGSPRTVDQRLEMEWSADLQEFITDQIARFQQLQRNVVNMLYKDAAGPAKRSLRILTLMKKRLENAPDYEVQLDPAFVEKYQRLDDIFRIFTLEGWLGEELSNGTIGEYLNYLDYLIRILQRRIVLADERYAEYIEDLDIPQEDAEREEDDEDAEREEEEEEDEEGDYDEKEETPDNDDVDSLEQVDEERIDEPEDVPLSEEGVQAMEEEEGENTKRERGEGVQDEDDDEGSFSMEDPEAVPGNKKGKYGLEARMKLGNVACTMCSTTKLMPILGCSQCPKEKFCGNKCGEKHLHKKHP